jgi:Na+/H+ antiporter NhaA
LALTIPTRTRINAAEFSAEARKLLDEFDRTETGDLLTLTSKGQQDALFSLGYASKGVIAPLQRLEHALHAVSAFVIMPLFAFANAGITIGTSALDWRVVLGIVLGLTAGKPLGIFGAGLRWPPAAALPGVAGRLLPWLGGMGFTMSVHRHASRERSSIRPRSASSLARLWRDHRRGRPPLRGVGLKPAAQNDVLAGHAITDAPCPASTRCRDRGHRA